jgi:DNA-binding winged helix-turn-helix (wHTH) protein
MPPQRHNVIYEFSGFRLDPSADYLTCEGQWVELEPVAMKVLTILVEHHPNPVRDNELMRLIWGLQDVDGNRREQAVSAIRKVLKDDSKNATFIRRVRNTGYQFVAQVTKLTKPSEKGPKRPREPWWRNLTGQYIVGRDEEMCLLSNMITGKSPHMCNIYGPGGIGKTFVCYKFEEWCRQRGIPYATVTGDDSKALTLGQTLAQFRDGLEQNVPKGIPEGAFDEFARESGDYKAVDKLLDMGGGSKKIFGRSGNLRNPRSFKTLFDEEGRDIKKHFVDRGALERYIGGIDRELNDSFIESVTGIVKDGNTKVMLLIDAYEMMEGLDE